MQSVRAWRRPVVVGASGQLGAALCQALEAAGSATVIRTSRKPQKGFGTLDLAGLHTVSDAADALQASAPDVIVCAGAMTYVDGCEENEAEALRANAYGPSFLAAYAHSVGVPFVFFSSDYVFDGTMEHPGPYSEADAVAPLSVYGRSKLEGERAVLRVHPEALVLRTSWVYGPDAAGKNFISTLVRQLRAGQRMRVPHDQVSTPTFNQDLAENTLHLVQSRASGVVHATGPELMSRYELAQKVVRFFGLNGELVEGVATNSLGQRAARPLRSGLVSKRLPALAPGVRFRSLEEGLEAMTSSGIV